MRVAELMVKLGHVSLFSTALLMFLRKKCGHIHFHIHIKQTNVVHMGSLIKKMPAQNNCTDVDEWSVPHQHLCKQYN